MAPTCDSNTKASELVEYYAPRIVGKTILITGPSPGSLGESFVKHVAAGKPSTLILAGRSVSKMQPVCDDLRSTHPDINVKLLSMDLMSFESVRQAAKAVMSWPDVPHIDLLVNNAGIMAVPYKLTEDGFESQFQTNHLSHFLFTNLIMNKILSSKAPRVVFVSSGVHRVGNIRWTDYNFNGGKNYQRWLGYGQSKTANALTALAIAKRLGSKGLLCFGMCPGVSYTNLAAHGLEDQAAFSADLTEMDNIYGNKWLFGMQDMQFKTLDQGAATHVFASFDTTINDHNGVFLSDCHIADPDLEEVYSWATSEVDADRLWKLSEKLVGQEFNY
ncbi:short-chain dehydrogenase reductase family [Colletotrichum truncatum]|uniref:Short-chain dehydrogenase reductase family n=1 Tax=Colletotrichum truncatum TaxID=5467 RepID=A0ACC3YJS8_COLTU|nr:short-chain dehydrogenase reductase family [Colletotrichum truncatum]KAF6797409.1 short-chain dehydrogenase reductase family [Colletotrichum truncatum]